MARAFAREGAIVVVADAGVDLDGTSPNRAPVETTVAELVESGYEAHASFRDVTAPNQVHSMLDDELPDSKRWATGEFDPDHVPPALVYRASDAGHWINGCVLATFGYEVHLYRLAERTRSIYSVGPGDQAMLDQRFEETFAPMVSR